MNEYLLLIFLMGFVLIYGVVYTIRLFHKLNVYVLKNRRLEVVQLSGVILMVMGSSITGMKGAISSSWPWVFLPLIATFIGISMLVLPFARIGHLPGDRETLLQIGIIAATVVMYPHFTNSMGRGLLWGALVVGILTLMLLLVKVPLTLQPCTPFSRYVLRIASWFLVLHSWIRYYGIMKLATCPHYWVMLLYLSALLIWLYSVMRTYGNVSRWL